MNKVIFFLFLLQCTHAISCSEKTLSTLFKLMHKNESPDEPCITKKPKDSYVNHLNNFHQHTESLRNAIEQAQTNSDDTETIASIRSTIIIEDLIPLRHKIYNLLDYIKQNNLYQINPDQAFNKIKYSPRIKIIDSIITILKDNTVQLDDKTIENYQYIMNHIAHFSIKKSHDERLNAKILAALETVSSGDKCKAQYLARLLNEETLNKEALKKRKNNLETCLPYVQ